MADDNKKNGGAKSAATGGGQPMTAADPAEIQAKIEAQAEARKQAQIQEHERFLEKLKREREEAEKLRPLPPITQAVSASVARPKDTMVVMIFPRPMFVWAEPVLDKVKDDPIYARRLKVAFGAGIQDVPESLADHWYLEASGVKKAAIGDKVPA